MDAVLINGVASGYVSVADRGLHYGDGLFETIACSGTHPQFIEQHLQRLQYGAGRLDIVFPDRHLMLQDIHRLLQDGDNGKSVLKLILTRGSGARGYRYQTPQTPTRIAIRSAWPEHAMRWARDGIRACFCRTRASVNPALAGIKSLNRLENVLASGELGRDHDEGFLCDSDGHVVEGTMSNLFAVIDDRLVTPDLSRCGIAGIMRAQVIAGARESGIRVETAAISPDDLINAQEIFVSNSVIGICGVKQLEQKNFHRHMITDSIRAAVTKRIDADAKAAT